MDPDLREQITSCQGLDPQLLQPGKYNLMTAAGSTGGGGGSGGGGVPASIPENII